MANIYEFRGANDLGGILIPQANVAYLTRLNNLNETPRLTGVHLLNGDKITIAGEPIDVAEALGFNVMLTELHSYGQRPFNVKPKPARTSPTERDLPF